MHVLVIANPGASRAETVTRELAQWFSEHATSTFVCTDSIEDLKQALDVHAPAADRIVIGGGDGTISSALPELLRLNKPLAVTARNRQRFLPHAWPAGGCDGGSRGRA